MVGSAARHPRDRSVGDDPGGHAATRRAHRRRTARRPVVGGSAYDRVPVGFHDAASHPQVARTAREKAPPLGRRGGAFGRTVTRWYGWMDDWSAAEAERLAVDFHPTQQRGEAGAVAEAG